MHTEWTVHDRNVPPPPNPQRFPKFGKSFKSHPQTIYIVHALKGSGCCNIDENRIEQCFAAHIVHSCQQYWTTLLHPIHAQQYCSTLLTSVNNVGTVWPDFLSGYYQTLCWNFTKLDFFYQTCANSALWNFWPRAVIVVTCYNPFWPFSWRQHNETVK
jgi:hypothetical protein